ncbi:MAG: hypothetical protein UT24_C0003G0046 [Candidatus Woesebacteria bacterium GW2011_GWB1_39_12]|uniref:Uncharacterized protein n=1 Tax=Candidatus Woesebacteria bacterium GW2011_GWB1_39_12 TaxID=1618574 RepID=A0A0G0MC80_9BACT|nr:MAG: hypothetical protein UT24_C0003G0046 [Candidatus Woesebacteria bacterium GW2011_GWB1_39_12]
MLEQMREVVMSATISVLMGDHESVVCRRYKCHRCGKPILKPISKKGKPPKRCGPCAADHIRKQHLDPYWRRKQREYKRRFKEKQRMTQGLPVGTLLSDTRVLDNGHVAAYVLLNRKIRETL